MIKILLIGDETIRDIIPVSKCVYKCSGKNLNGNCQVLENETSHYLTYVVSEDVVLVQLAFSGWEASDGICDIKTETVGALNEIEFGLESCSLWTIMT